MTFADKGTGLVDEQPSQPEFRSRALNPLIGSTEIRDVNHFNQHTVPYLIDQGDSESCVGQTVAEGVRILAKLQGYTLPRLSALQPWTYGRQPFPGGKLINEGCRPSFAINGMHKHGIVTHAQLPFSASDKSNWNKDLPWDVYTAGWEARINNYYYLGDGDLNGLRRALSAGHVVCIAHDIDRHWDSYKGGLLSGPVDRNSVRGGHYVLLGAQRNGATEFGHLNWWGEDFGENGIIWMDQTRVLESRMAIVLAVSPLGVAWA